jgi:hypothetical protein
MRRKERFFLQVRKKESQNRNAKLGFLHTFGRCHGLEKVIFISNSIEAHSLPRD